MPSVTLTLCPRICKLANQQGLLSSQGFPHSTISPHVKTCHQSTRYKNKSHKTNNLPHSQTRTIAFITKSCAPAQQLHHTWRIGCQRTHYRNRSHTARTASMAMVRWCQSQQCKLSKQAKKQKQSCGAFLSTSLKNSLLKNKPSCPQKVADH